MQTNLASPLTGALRMLACGLGLLAASGLAAAQTVNSFAGPGTSTVSQQHIDSRPSDEELAKWPDRLVPIPPLARRAEMIFDTTNTVKVKVRGRDRYMDPEKERKDWEKDMMLAPGVRIFGADNMLKMYGSLKGRFKTKYITEPATGLLMQVWILTPKEIWTPDPEPVTGTTPAAAGNMGRAGK